MTLAKAFKEVPELGERYDADEEVEADGETTVPMLDTNRSAAAKRGYSNISTTQ